MRIYGLDSAGSNRDQWWALVIKVTNLQVPEQARNFLTS